MSLTIELKPEIEARVRARAAERGLPVEKFLEAAIEHDMTRAESRRTQQTLSAEDWDAALDEFMKSSSFRNVSWTVDDSREGIYREREDAQL